MKTKDIEEIIAYGRANDRTNEEDHPILCIHFSFQKPERLGERIAY